MAGGLRISIGQHSDRGRKEINQDFFGAIAPAEPEISLKGAAIAIADGISSSDVSQIAAESAVKSFLTDYYCTPDSWTAKTAASRVIAAANSWLHAQTRAGRFEDADRGYVCAFSALIVKGRRAHVFHVGDARVFRVQGGALEQLTEDHRVVVSSRQSYLGRALGVNPQVEIDYRAVPVEAGDVFVLATDGVYEFAQPAFMASTIRACGDLDAAARAIVEEAARRGSDDNMTVQVLRIDAAPGADADAAEALAGAQDLPPAPLLEPRARFEGFTILRTLHASSRSHLYLATDDATGARVALKVPSIDLREDRAYLRRFAMEEWIARRVSSAHVMKAHPATRRRDHLYAVCEFIEGRSLEQWMRDNPRPALDAVRGLVDQIARGLQALHRREMIHQDLRPANVMIDLAGVAKIIDFGSTRVAGVVETAPATDGAQALGALQYVAPECFVGAFGAARSDVFSLGVVAYEMLTGRLPYGAAAARVRSPQDMRRLAYVPACATRGDLPPWVDAALRKATHPDPARRFAEPLEFAYALRHPVVGAEPSRLIERDPLRFWKIVSGLLALTSLALAFLLARQP